MRAALPNISRIEETDRWIADQLATIPTAKRRILTSHDAFGYYCARYGITLRSIQGVSTIMSRAVV